MKHSINNRLLTLLLAALLTSCGGGGGSSPEIVSGGSGSGGTGGSGGSGGSSGGGSGGGGDTGDTSAGISGSGKAIGVITQFGSIFVNGVEYDTSEAIIIVNGVIATEDDLGVGMVVFIQGTVNEDGVTGVAEVVIVDDNLKVQSVPLRVQQMRVARCSTRGRLLSSASMLWSSEQEPCSRTPHLSPYLRAIWWRSMALLRAGTIFEQPALS